MKKLLYFMAAMTVVFFTACDDMDHAIADQTDRIDQLEKLSIKEIEDQITAINASIEDLEAVDKELDGYIQTLEVTAGNLQKELEDVNTGIDNLKSELEGEISTAKQELLDKLTDLQKDIENELGAIRKDIEELEAKDKELEGKIEDLQTYVDEKLGDTEDWAKATFATLEQYEALQEEVAEISESIAAINKSITDLETRVNDKIAADIKTATDALRTELGKDYTEKIDAAVKKVTEGYTTAVSAAKEEITAAYTKAIADAITASEKGMKEWVNKTLAEGYYDIAAIDAKLKELETSLTGADTELAEQIEAQKEALEQAKEDLKKAYEKAIADAIETNNGVITEAYEEAIDEAVEGLNATISGINTAIDDIKVKLGIIDKEITALKTRIQSIRFIPEYSDGMVEFDGTFTLKFILAPKAAAGEVTLAHVTSFISHAKERTRAAGDPEALTVASVTGDDQTGILEVAVSAASLTADFWADGYNANTYICISDGNNDIISEMIPTFTRPYVTFNAETEQTMKLSEGVAVRSSGASEGFEYSVGWGAWTPLTSDPVTFGHDHGALRLRGKSETGTEGKKIEFGNNTEVAASGDIRTLIDWTGHDTAETGNAVFAGLFQGCTQLTSAPELPSTELAEGCYENMFAGCTNLTEAPVLPAPVLTENCYKDMFSGCTSLESVTISATDTSADGCMDGMLEDVELKEPSVIVATTAEDLAAKIEEVPAGSTIRLGGDIESGDILIIEKTLTLEGNGYTLTYTGSGAGARAINVLDTANGADLTVRNLTINCTASYCQRGINYNTNGSLTLENVTVDGTNITYAVNLPGSSDNATVTITDCKITGNIALNVWGENMKITVTNSVLTSVDKNDQENYSAISLNNDGTTSAEGTAINITGGSIRAEDQNGNPSTAVKNGSVTGKVNISGTTVIVGEILIPVAVVLYEGQDSFYSCFTLNSAIKQALKDNTGKASLKLLTDIVLGEDETITVPSGQKLVLDLNGHNINSTVSNDGKAYAIFSNNGTLNLVNSSDTESTLQFVADDPDLQEIPGYATNTISNYGTLTIGKNVTVTNGSEGGASYAVDNHAYFTLDGGTLIGNRCALRIAKYNPAVVEFTMNSGYIKAKTPAWIQLPGSSSSAAPQITVNITGGTMESTKESSADNDVMYTYSYGNSHANTSITISGGEFLGGTVSIGAGYKGDAPTLTISGGEFEYDVIQWLENDGSKVVYTKNK